MCSKALLIVLLSLFCCAIHGDERNTNPQDVPGNDSVMEEGENESYFSTVDYILLTALLSAGAYFLFFRGNTEDALPEYEIKPMTIRQESVSEKGFITKLRKQSRRLIVFYGSQTGTAEEFAGRLAKEGARYGMKGIVVDPEEEDMDQLMELKDYEEEIGAPCLTVFMMATYGEGDPTDNAMDFNEKLTEGSLKLDGLAFSVFALGNKTYEHYNAMGKFVDKRLGELGGKRIFDLGMGDDDANLEEDFITWKEKFWEAVCLKFDIESSGEDINTRNYEHKVLSEGDYNPDKIYTGEIARLKSYIKQRPPFDMKNPLMAPITVNKNIHKEGSGRTCLHIEVDTSTGGYIRYDAGDHVAVYPTNNVDLVNRLLKLLDIDGDTVFTLNNLDEDSTKKHPFPCPTTYRTALLHYVDISAIPRTHILQELSKYTDGEEDRSKLELMSATTTEGKALYSKWIMEDVRHLVHILEDLPTCRPPIDHLLELLPRLQPRFYSIASSSKVHRHSVHICAVVVEYATPTGRTNLGVATTWLRELVPPSPTDTTDVVDSTGDAVQGDSTEPTVSLSTLPRVPIYIRRSQFRLPNRPMTPVIMIGPGTGLAPFRGFIQERAWQKAQGKPVGPTLLFFGCRNKDKDYIYQDELEAWQEDGLLDLRVAFSRDQAEKRYVTHLMREAKEYIWQLLQQGAHLYVCGDAKMMAKDVRNIIAEIYQTEGNMSETEAEQQVKKLETQKRYSADVWS